MWTKTIGPPVIQGGLITGELPHEVNKADATCLKGASYIGSNSYSFRNSLMGFVTEAALIITMKDCK